MSLTLQFAVTLCLVSLAASNQMNMDVVRNEEMGIGLWNRLDYALSCDTKTAEEKRQALMELKADIEQQRGKRHTLPGDSIRQCCKVMMSHGVRTTSYPSYYQCSKSSSQRYTTSCGFLGWSRCTRHRTYYYTSNCCRYHTQYHTVEYSCPPQHVACCVGTVYVRSGTYNGVTIQQACVSVDEFIRILGMLEN